GRRAQPAPARRAVGASGKLQRERGDVGIGIAGARHQRRLHLQHVAGEKELAHQSVHPGAQSHRIARGRWRPPCVGADVVAPAGTRPEPAHGPTPCSARNASGPSASQAPLPSSRALASLEPAASPATTRWVFFGTLPATLAPSAWSFSPASSRVIEDRLPVSTTVR